MQWPDVYQLQTGSALPTKATGACTESIRAGPELYSILTFLPASQLTAGKVERLLDLPQLQDHDVSAVNILRTAGAIVGVTLKLVDADVALSDL